MPDALQQSLQFFFSTLTELLLLFVLINMLVIWLQQRFPPARIQQLLSGRGGYLTAASLGALTPFCSCSTLPLLVGLLRAQAQFGPVMTFLLVSPLLNPLLVVMLWSLFSWQITLIYSAAVLAIALLAGLLLQGLGFARYVSLPEPVQPCCHTAGAAPALTAPSASVPAQLRHLLLQALHQTRSFLPHLLLGVAVGAVIHGYVPAQWLSQLAQPQPWWLIPLAALLGIPLYVRASSMLPLALSLVGKGLSYGSVVALTIGGAGASLPELILLKRIFQWPLLLSFVAVVFITACLTGVAIDGVLLP